MLKQTEYSRNKRIKKLKKMKNKKDKLEEEMSKMAKLELKDGKLQKVEDSTKDVAPMPPVEQPQAFGPTGDTIPSEDMVPQEPIQQTPVEQPMPPMEQPMPPMEQPMPPQMEAPVEQQMPPSRGRGRPSRQDIEMRQELLRQQQQAEQNPFENIPPQQFVNQPNLQVPPTPAEAIAVSIKMIEGDNIIVKVPIAEMREFLKVLSETIDNQASMPIGKKVLNGRYIISYSF